MDCLDLAQLERLAGDGSPEANPSPTSAHVEACSTCRDRLAEIRANLRLAGRIGALGPGGGDDSARPAPGAQTDPPTWSPAQEAHSSARRHLLPPDAFPGYDVLREIHRGGQGLVYQAIQKSTRRKVAIKVIREVHFADAADHARFAREVQILGQLKHPGIVTIHDSGAVDGRPFLVMDYIPGKHLDAWVADLKSSSRNPRDHLRAVLRLFATVCAAVHAAHRRGIIHRDLKPSNIRVDHEGQPHVLDFGLAKVAGAPEHSHARAMTMTGVFVGSLPWSSPEQAEGVPSKIDIRTDVYSLGVVLHQLLTDRFPYDVTGPMRQVLDRIQGQEPASPRTLVPAIDDELESIILTCLAKDRERRYQSAGELERDLRRYLAGESIEARRRSGWYFVRTALRRRRVHLAVAAGFIAIVGLASTLTVAWTLLITLLVAQAALATAWRRAARERDRALAAETRARGVVRFLKDVFAMGNPLSERRASSGLAPRRPAPLYAGRSGHPPSVVELLPAALQWLDGLQLDPLLDAEIRHLLGTTLADMGRFDDAIAQIRAAAAARSRICGPNSIETLDSRRRLVDALLLRGNKEEALAQSRDAYERLRRTHGAENPMTLAFATLAAQALEKCCRADEAIELLRHATDAAAANGADRDQIVLRRLDLARALTEGNRSLESLKMADECLSELSTGPEAPRLYARAVDVRAQALFNLGRFREAEDASRKAVRAFAREFGPDHPLTAFQMIHLARNVSERGDLREALRIAKVSLEYQRRAGGDEHPWTYRAERCVVRQWVRLGIEAPRAEAMARHAAAGFARLYSPHHEATLYARDAHALALQRQGRLDEAEAILRDNVRIGAQTVGGWWYARHLESLGLCLADQGRFAEAEEQLVAARQRVEQWLGADAEPAQQMARHLTRLCEQRCAAEPGDGLDQRAAA